MPYELSAAAMNVGAAAPVFAIASMEEYSAHRTRVPSSVRTVGISRFVASSVVAPPPTGIDAIDPLLVSRFTQKTSVPSLATL